MRKAIERRKHPGAFVTTGSSNKTLMMNPARRAIYTELCRRPCLSSGELARTLGTSRANATWHLNKMVKAGLLAKARNGGKWGYLATNHISDEEKPLFSVLGNPVARRLYLKIKERPGATQVALSKALALQRQDLSWHLEKLERVGLVGTIRDGRFKRYRATPLFNDMAKAHSSRLGHFKGALMKALREDNTSPSIVKALSRSLLVRMSTGEGTSILEVMTDPYEQVLKGPEKAKNVTRKAK
jgi:DNA-binding MarR family transcriptional regulator